MIDAPHEKVMTERERAEENVRAIVEELDRPTLALLYKTSIAKSAVGSPGHGCLPQLVAQATGIEACGLTEVLETERPPAIPAGQV
jgi:hypothetical protein